ncbi:MAG: glycosyltransferase, partial [Eubacteriaceae bacterium]
MDKKTKLSVIVPVYNMEKYLRKCLDSLVGQTLEDIQIIIVNDGSTDDSQSIIDEYCQEFGQKIMALKKENGGLSDARNFGMQYAQSEYYTFMDSDDWVEKEAYEKMYNKAVSDNFDIVVCDTNFIFTDHLEKVGSGIDNDVIGDNLIKRSYLSIFPAAWNKIYHSRLIQTNIRFTKGVWFEDVEYIYKILTYVKSIGIISEPLYQYLQRENSITYTFNEKIFD